MPSDAPSNDENKAAHIVVDQPVDTSASFTEEKDIVVEEKPSDSLLETLKSYLPTSLRSTEIEHATTVSTDLKETPTVVEDLTKVPEVQVQSQAVEPVVSPVEGYYTSRDVYHAYKQPAEPIIESKPETSGLIEKATAVVSSIISSLTTTSTPESSEEITSVSDSQIIDQDKVISSTTDEQLAVTKPSEEEPSSESLLETLKSYLPTSLVSAETKDSLEDEKREEASVSSVLEELSTAEVDLTKAAEVQVESQVVEPVSGPVEGHYTSRDVYHAYKQPIQPVIETESVKSGLIEKATSVVTSIISSPSVSSSVLKPAEESSASSELQVEEKSVGASLVEGEDINGLKVSSSAEEQVSDSVSETSKSDLPCCVAAAETQIITSEVPVVSVKPDLEIVSSPVNETVVADVSKQPVAAVAEETIEKFETETVVGQTSSTTEEVVGSTIGTEVIVPTESNISDGKVESETVEVSEIAGKEPLQEAEKKLEKDEKEISSNDTSDTITSTPATSLLSTLQPVSTSEEIQRVDLKQDTATFTTEEKATGDLVEEPTRDSDISKEEFQQQDISDQDHSVSIQSDVDHGEKPVTEQVLEEHDRSEATTKDVSPVKEEIIAIQDTLTTTPAVDTDVQAVIPEPSVLSIDEVEQTPFSTKDTISIETHTDGQSLAAKVSSIENQSECLNVNEDEGNLVETAKGILATPLPSDIDTLEKTGSTTDQPSSSITTTSILEETKKEDLVEKKPSEQLQVIGDDYPWYSNYYNIADADAKLGPLYENLTNTIKQLEQRPVPTIVEIQPEPHESVVIPEYDHKVLADTKDTREKVHELAELSTQLTSTITKPQAEEEQDESGFQVVHHRRRVPSSTSHDKEPSPTRISSETSSSPDINLAPLVIHGHPTAPTNVSTTTSEMTSSTSSTTHKKKHKKPKKSTEDILFDAPVPSVSETDKEKSSTTKPEVAEVHSEITESEPSPSKKENKSPEIDQSHDSGIKHETKQPSEEIESQQVQSSEEIKHETEYRSEDVKQAIGILNQTVEELKQTLTDTTSEEQHGEIVSTSVLSELAEPHPQTDDDNNDSTSSDASQWPSSSCATFLEETKTDTHTADQSLVTETQKEPLSTAHESIKSEKSSSSSSTKKKKSKPKPIDQKKHEESKHQETASVIEEPKLELKQASPSTVKTTTATVVTKVVTPLKQPEQEQDIDDNEGFQVVTYRKHPSPAVAHEKLPIQPSTTTLKKRSGSDTDRKQVVAREDQSLPVPVATSTSGPTKQTTTTAKATTKKKTKTVEEDRRSPDIPLSSTSTDNDIVSSSSVDKSSTKNIEQEAIEQEKIASVTSESKLPSSSSLTTSISPSTTTAIESKQKQKDDEVFVESQVSSPTVSIAHESEIKSEPILPTPPRIKAFTSPEEEEKEDDEGFRVVHHRKRISSAPRADKGLPPLPPQPHRQYHAHNVNSKPFTTQGRQGSGSRSIPRANTGDQIPYHRRHPERPKQDRRQMPPSHPPHSPTSQETHTMSSLIIENRTVEQTQQPISDVAQKVSDNILQSSSIDQKLFKQLEEIRPTIIYETPQVSHIEPTQTSLPIVQPKPLEKTPKQITHIEYQPALPPTEQLKTLDQNRQEIKAEAKFEPISQPVRKVHEEHPKATETKASVQQPSVPKEKVSSTITTTSTISTKHRPSTEEEDEDGFRVVRYRKHTPSSPTAATFSKQHSYSSDGEKKPSNIPRKQIPSPSATTSTSSASQSSTPKRKPKKTKEGPATTEPTSSTHIHLPPTHGTDVASSVKEEPRKRAIPKHTQKSAESQPTTKATASSHSDKESKITSIDHKTLQPLKTTEVVEKVKDDSRHQVQPAESTASASVTSADTSEEQAKKTKKRHKRIKREPGVVNISTPSDDVSGKTDGSPTKQSIVPHIPSPTTIPDISSTSSKVEEKSDKTPVKEENLSLQSIQPTTHADDEQIQTASGKKHPRRRKKKPQTNEKQDQEESELNSSAITTSDKDSSSATGIVSKTPSEIESTTPSHVRSGDDNEDSELNAAENNMTKTKSTESSTTPESTDQKLSLYPHSTLQPTTIPKNVPEKVTDVQFKFEKSGELIITSQVPLESSPTQWGTVQFESDESSLLAKHEATLSAEVIPQEQQSTVKTEVPVESIVKTELPVESTVKTELPVESTVKTELPVESTLETVPPIQSETTTDPLMSSIGSSETTGEADLEAYRDQSGHLRRKKPRKHPSHLVKEPEGTSTPITTTTISTTTTTIETEPSEEIKLDHQTISEHWAAVLATPISNTDEDEKAQVESTQHEQIYKEADTSETSNKLDSFLPEYIRQQIKVKTSPRSSSSPHHDSKASSEPLASTVDTPSIHAKFSPTLLRSPSTDTSENESRKYTRESHDEENPSAEDSHSQSTSHQIEQDLISTSSSSVAARKKKQRPKMLKKDVEAKTLLTHEFDDTPFTITEIQATAPISEGDKSPSTSLHSQFTSAISTLTDFLTSALSTPKPSSTDELKSPPQSDEPVPSIHEPIPTETITTSITTTTKKKSSTHSPRKRSKRDSGPDYDKLTIPSSDDAEQPVASIKTATTALTSVDTDQTDLIKVETHKHQARQRTPSGRQVITSQEENEQQAILADDEEDEDLVTKSSAAQGTGVGTHMQTPIESIAEQQDSSTTSAKKKRQKKKSATEEVEFVAQVTDELKSDQEDISSSDQQSSTSNEKLRPVQGFHSFTPNKYQYNQYEEGPTGSNEQSISLITTSTTTDTTTASQDEVVARGFNIWLKQNTETQPSSSIKNEEQPETASSLTRAMQSLIIQPVETDDDEDEEDSWNGPRARKPTYTTGIRAEKRIHVSSGYNINHPRTITVSPWLMPKSTDNTYQDDSSKFDPDDEDDSINDASDRLQLSHTIDTQVSTQEERQMHLNNLTDLGFQSAVAHLSSSSSSLSSAAKWNETALRTDDNNQQQTNFTEDDVQRCLGENFYRESLGVDPLQAEQRTITGLNNLVVKPSQSLEETDNDEDLDDDNQKNRNSNNNNNNPSTSFDEWGHFFDYNNDQQMFQSSGSTASGIQQRILTSYECSYARELDDDTLITDADRSHLIDYVQHSYENDGQRYGDFSYMNDDSNVSESMTNRSSLSTNLNSQSPHRLRPSQTFQRWRNQSNRDRQESNSNVTLSTENQNDDEIFVSHTDGGLSRRVRPTQ